MNGYLFDTNIVRRWFARNQNIEARVNALDENCPLYISAVTLGEIECHHKHVPPNEKQAEFRKWIRENFQIPQLPITNDTAQEYADLRRKLFDIFDKKNKYLENREDRLGTKLGVDENDLWLVAQCYERNLTLITHDSMANIRQVLDKPDRIEVWPE